MEKTVSAKILESTRERIRVLDARLKREGWSSLGRRTDRPITVADIIDEAIQSFDGKKK